MGRRLETAFRFVPTDGAVHAPGILGRYVFDHPLSVLDGEDIEYDLANGVARVVKAAPGSIPAWKVERA